MAYRKIPTIRKADRPFNEEWIFPKSRDQLTMAELRELYKMYQADCNIQTISLYMRITKEYALVCIEAAKWLYTGQLHRLKQRRLDIFKASIRPPEKFFKDDKRGEYKRPPAIYTNQRPYDFDK